MSVILLNLILKKMIEYFTNLLRVICDVSQVSQCEAAKEVPSGVKKAAIDIVDNTQPFQSDIRNLVDRFGALQDGKVIEVGL